jgi:hypothetical protein
LLERADYRLERKLERELDDLHIRALLAWGTHGMPKDGEGRQRHLSLLEQLLERFLPDDFGALTACRDSLVNGDGAAEYDDSLRAVIDDWAASDPAWWSLRFAVEDDQTTALFPPVDAARQLRRAVESRGLPNGLSIWLGDRLWDLSERLADEPEDETKAEAQKCRAAAHAAYGRAASSDDPAMLFELGNTLRHHGLLDESLAAFERSRAFAEVEGDTGLPAPPTPSEHRRTIATVLWKLGRTSDASAELAAIDAGQLTPEVWRAELVRQLLEEDSVHSPEAYRPLKNWLGRIVTRAQVAGDAVVLRDAADALLELTLRRYQLIVRRPHDKGFAHRAADMMPTVPPVVLAADAALFGEGEETEAKRMLDPNTGPLAMMKARVKDSFGVGLPAVRVSPIEGAAPGRYTILINGVPIAAGTAGDDGSSRSHRYASMLEQLQEVLLGNLDAFLGIQQVVWLLDEWEAEDPEEADERREMRGRAVPDDESLARLAAVLQALVQEGVPLKDLSAVLGAFSAVSALPDATRRVEMIRSTMTDILPGTDASRQLIRVPHEIENVVAAWTHVRHGKRFLALPGKDAEELRVRLANTLAAATAPAPALVVSEAELRPAVRKLAGLEHPAVPVVSLNELPDTVLNSTDWSGGL